MTSTSSSVTSMIKTIIEAVFMVVVAGALFPFLADQIATANFTSPAASTIIALLPMFLALAMAYKLISNALSKL
jgi:K+-transporting ATPase c subunit